MNNNNLGLRYNPTIANRNERRQIGIYDSGSSLVSDPVEAMRELSVNEYFLTPVQGERVTGQSIGANGLQNETESLCDRSKQILWKREPNKTPKALDIVRAGTVTRDDSGTVTGRSGWHLPNLNRIGQALREMPGTLNRTRAANGGDAILWTFNVDRMLIGGQDAYDTLFSVFVSQREGIAHSAFFHAEQLWCANQVYTIAARASVGLTLGHCADASVEELIAFVLDLRTRIEGGSEGLREFLETIARVQIEREQVLGMFEAALPFPSAPQGTGFGSAEGIDTAVSEMRANREHSAILDNLSDKERKHVQACARIAIDRELMLQSYNTYSADGRPFVGSVSHAFAAVTEVMSHASYGTRENVGDNVLFGTRRRAIERAAEYAETLIGN